MTKFGLYYVYEVVSIQGDPPRVGDEDDVFETMKIGDRIVTATAHGATLMHRVGETVIKALHTGKALYPVGAINEKEGDGE